MTAPTLTNSFLEALGQRTGTKVEFYDPDGSHHGFPTFPYRYAPDGLATRRQLRAAGLRPNGQPVIAQILWRHRKQVRIAYLYRRDLAAPKRHATPAQLAVVAKMLLARRTCRHCGQLRDYYIPRSTGACLVCEPGGPR
ncbi:RRQRL motif-containing zinc-binding protein [Actinoplanes sp. NPDC049118]|uniref:RRQRL motif-containing zinc-binding protein n=1 Tax=Actinoplanes sp. NPDC049118 TaxID=3155769 RepID=UPI00340AEEA6